MGNVGQANPIACAAALESARLLEGNPADGTSEHKDEFRQGNTWYDPDAFDGKGGVRASFSESDVRDLSLLPGVKGVMSLGSVLSVELKPNSPPLQGSTSTSISSSNDAENSGTGTNGSTKNSRYYNSSSSGVVVSLLKSNNVYARPLGNVVYLMPTPMTPEIDRQRLIRVTKR